MTPGTRGSASRNFCCASGNVSSCALLMVEAGEEFSVETFAASSLTSTLSTTVSRARAIPTTEVSFAFRETVSANGLKPCWFTRRVYVPAGNCVNS